MKEKIYIYYTNDLHSDFKQWPRTAGFLKDKKMDRNEREDEFFLVDVGDHMDRVHPLSEATMGRANIALMNEVGYDVVTLGNNEGITLSHDDLYHLYDDAEFDVVCANLNDKENKPPSWLNNTVIKETDSGVRLGFIGLTAPFTPFYKRLGWDVRDPYQILEEEINHLSREADSIILLSHLGLSEDEEIARRFPAIDVIIGGHTHHLLRNGKYIKNSLLTAAGKHCMFTGEVILTYDHEKNQLTKKEAYTTSVSNYKADEDTKSLLKELETAAETVLNQEIVTLPATLYADWFHETPLMQGLTDTLRNWTQADVSLLNAGLILDDLKEGTITYGEIHRVCPHPINPVVVHLSGDELLEVVRGSLKKEFMEIPLKGFGFRGEVIGRMLFSGLEIETTVHDNQEETVKSLRLSNNRPVNKDETYRVATADTFTFGRLLPEIARSEVKDYFLPEFLRELLIQTLKEG
jgi:2',3'-cyclic-nucleotide 2'-phosphodiesterase (5'-nucleotidase family)